MSRTTRSRRGRCVALAAVTAGVSWLTTGPAMAGSAAAGDGAVAGLVCEPTAGGQTGALPSSLARTGRTTLAPATGVLSVADAAGAAAGRGMPSLPGRSVKALPVGGASAIPAFPSLSSTGGKAILPEEKSPLTPVLSVAPARPSVPNALCLPTAPMSATQPLQQDRVHPITNPQPGQPQVQGESRTGANAARTADASSASAPAANRPHRRGESRNRADARATEAQPAQAQDRPRRRNRGAQAEATPQQRANQAQTGGGQRNAARPAPRHARPAQQNAAESAATRSDVARSNTAQKGADQAATTRDKRQRRPRSAEQAGQAGQTGRAAAAPTTSDSAASPRRAQREGRVYPKAPTEQPGLSVTSPGDITAPALAQATATGPLADFAAATGRQLLP